jgi:competence protein ComEC
MRRPIFLLLVFALFHILLFGGVQIQASAKFVVIINEIEANPAGTDSGFEKVELYNLADVPTDVGGWRLSSTAGIIATVTIESGTIIPANGHLVVGHPSQWIDDIDETIVLKNQDGLIADTSITFSDEQNDGRTWQRSPDNGTSWVFDGGTLGGPNAGTANVAEQVPEPEPTPEPEPPNPLTPPPNDQPLQPPSLGPLPSGQELKIVFIDVGQGSSQLIILPNTNTILIDGGDRDQAESVLAALQSNGISRIDVMVATHPHSDHVGGLIEIINRVEVKEVLDSGQIHTTQTFEDFIDAIDSKQIPLTTVHQGDDINLDPAVQLKVLNPPTSLPNEADDESKFNDNSIVIKLTYGEFTALFTADIEEAGETRLYQTSSSQLDADVLTAGHHGSATSSTAAFLNQVKPDVVVISVGVDNNYGHPHQEALNRIDEVGTQHVFRTDIDGTIVLTSSGGSEYSIETSRSGKTVVVPEFGIAIAITSISLIAIILLQNGVRVWKLSKQA